MQNARMFGGSAVLAVLLVGCLVLVGCQKQAADVAGLMEKGKTYEVYNSMNHSIMKVLEIGPNGWLRVQAQNPRGGGD